MKSLQLMVITLHGVNGQLAVSVAEMVTKSGHDNVIHLKMADVVASSRD